MATPPAPPRTPELDTLTLTFIGLNLEPKEAGALLAAIRAWAISEYQRGFHDGAASRHD